MVESDGYRCDPQRNRQSLRVPTEWAVAIDAFTPPLDDTDSVLFQLQQVQILAIEMRHFVQQ